MIRLMFYIILLLKFWAKIVWIDTKPRRLAWYFNYPTNPLYMNNTFIGPSIEQELNNRAREVMNWKLGYPFFDLYPLVSK